MAENNRAGNSRLETGIGAGSSSTRAGYESRAFSPHDDEDFQGYGYARQREGEGYPRTRTGLALDDGIILLGIILGGTAGYFLASSVNSDRAGKRAWRSVRSSERDHASGRRTQTRSHRPVEHDETTDLIASNKVESTAIYNRRGDKLGEVHNFMVGKRSGQVAYAVMSFGGFLGIGQKYHPLPWNMLTYDTTKKGYVVHVDKDELMGAPSYGAGEEPFSQPEYGMHVRDYWDTRRRTEPPIFG